METTASRKPRFLALLSVFLPALMLMRAAVSEQTDQPIARELAAKILSVAGRMESARIDVRDRNKADTPEGSEFKRALEAELQRAGVGIRPDASVGAVIEVTISDSLQGTLYVAEIRSADAKNIAMVLRPPGKGELPSDRVTPVTLQLAPLVMQEEPILDVLPGEDALIILGTTNLTVQRTGGGEPGRQSVPLSHDHPWPRDVRGRIRSDGNSLQVYLPGVLCKGTTRPLILACADSSSAWPLDIADSRLVPDRNYFEAEGMRPFFSAARVGTADDARWLVAGVDGKSYLYNSNREPLAVVDDLGSDLVALHSSCGSGTQVLASVTDDTGAADLIEAFELIYSRAMPASPPVRVSGRVTALWRAPGGAFAVAVTYNGEAGRYEAYRVTVACNR